MHSNASPVYKLLMEKEELDKKKEDEPINKMVG